MNHQYTNTGVYQKRLRHDKLQSGIYEVILTTDSGKEKEKMLVE
jgi:hypothetical protein